MLEYILNNGLYYVFVQNSSVFLVVYLFSGIKEKKSYFISSFFSVIMLTILYAHLNVWSLGLIWLTAVILDFIYIKKIHRAILFASLANILYIFANYVAGIPLSWGTGPFISSVEVLVAVGISIYLIIVLLLKKITTIVIKKVQVSERLVWMTAILSTITFISYFIIIIIERFGGEYSAMGKANEFFIIGYGLLSMLVFLALLYSLQKEYTAKEKQKEMTYLKDYTDQLEKNYTEMRRFKHDYQNILLSIEDYIKEKDLIKLEEYFYSKIKTASTAIEKNDFKLSQLGNLKVNELKSVLANKLSISQELGIDTEVEISERIEAIEADSIVLVRALGIILDNAIEAAEQIDNGMIRVAFFRKLNKLVIVVVNSCSKELPKLFELKKEGFSTKGENRGMGLSNLEQMVASTGNMMLDTKIDHGVFTQMLSIDEKK
ncbi:sensor histidine kinase [Enterococcus rotai]|uniref:sensor histidine kinase n=1 Tax=Enterococcus rotai TaxID=118060 RepID=UPI0035C70969